MGYDIYTITQKRINSQWAILPFKVFDHRSYGIFGFLANVRNFSMVPSISTPRGFPEDHELKYDYKDQDYHSHSWLSVKELTDFNYDRIFEDRRYVKQLESGIWSGSSTCAPGDGNRISFKEFLSPLFFDDLDILNEITADRILFCFDN